MNRWLLLFLSSGLLLAALFTTAFPVLSFFCLAPLFALAWPIADEAGGADKKSVLENAEIVLFALAISFVIYFYFKALPLFSATVLALAYTVPFLALMFIRRSLGERSGPIGLFLVWLALEYFMLKAGWPAEHWFLADLLEAKPPWSSLFRSQGYLAVSAWLLLTNLLAWAMVFRGKFSPGFAVLFVIAVATPLTMGILGTDDTHRIIREQMLSYYSTGVTSDATYGSRGEWVVRTAAWASVLVLLFAAVRKKTAKPEKPKKKS